jgi:hypothetical protein
VMSWRREEMREKRGREEKREKRDVLLGTL